MATGTSARWPLAVALAAVLVHLNTLGNGFALDDVALVEHNPSIRSISALPRLFMEPYAGEGSGLYRPLTVVSLAINRAVTGSGPSGFHAANVLLHAAAWLVLRRAGTHYGTALLGGLLFAVHPAHTEAVANVAGRAELLAALFVLAAWWAHPGRPLASSVLYFAAILSKEGAVLAPLLFWADDRLRGDERPLRSYAGYAVALAAMIGLRLLALGAEQGAATAIPLDNPAAAAGTVPRVLTATWVQLKYAMLLLWPHPLSSDYSIAVIPVARSVADPRVLAGAAFLGGLAAAVAWSWKRSRPLALAGLCWILFFLPASNLPLPTGTIMAERLAYLPSIGVCLAIGHLGAALAAEGRLRRTVTVAGAVVAIVVLAVMTLRRNPAWRDNLTLATTDVATYPQSAKLQAGAGIFLAAAGREREGEDHMRRALEIYPDYAQIHYNLAVLLVKRGARDEAVTHLERAIALAPGNPRPRALLDQLTR
jgi:hypothetical protein